jgi:hypothetical protein
VQSKGPHKVFVRKGQGERTLSFHFCPQCGSTVFWELDFRPNHVAVAVGAMADPTFDAPTRSVWEEYRHPWVAFDVDISRFARQSPP